MSIPAFSDISKSANDLLNKDFYHLSAGTIEVKSNTPNNVAFKVTGKSSHDKVTTGAIEGKYTDKPLGTDTELPLSSFSTVASAECDTEPPRTQPKRKQVRERPYQPPSIMVANIPGPSLHRRPVKIALTLSPVSPSSMLLTYRGSGFTLTQTWNTANALESKVEFADNLAKGLKAEGIFSFLPATQARGAKFNLYFKQPSFNGRAYFDLLKGPTANIDAVIGHEGFLAGAQAGYDVQKAAVTSYSAAVGFAAPTYTAAVTATDNLSVFAASYYHKVNSQVEAGAKATWNSKSGNNVGLEVASKYRLDPVSFVKAKINDRGVAALAYNVLLREGVTFGIGASFDTQKLDQATHKVGTSFTFES